MFGRKIIAELVEPDENLIRSQLTPAQEAPTIFRRKAIYATKPSIPTLTPLRRMIARAVAPGTVSVSVPTASPNGK